jgi:sterol 3beta-glucosyltransferase
MKITFLTLGSRGDVQPYVALAKELMKKGHEACICTGATYRGFIEENGIAFYEASADLMAIMESEEGRKVFNGGNYSWWKMLKFANKVITPAYRNSMDDFLDASREADLIIYHPKALSAVDIALYLDIPCICMPPVPIMYPIKEFPNFQLSPDKSFGPLFNKWSYKVIAFSEQPYIKYINDFREKSLHLPKRRAGSILFEANGKPIPILYPISSHLFRDVNSWKERVYLSGFFFLDIGEEALDEQLEEFLESGSKPIVVSFSSMPLERPDAFKEKLVQAVKETGNRAVVLTGTSGMTFEEEDDIFAVKKAPHRLIFKRAKGIIHHGGVGTMSEALLSGVPQLVMPFTVDQPFWAARLYAKGYTIRPLREKTLKTADLMEALREMENETVIVKANEIKEIIESENGLAQAIHYIEALMKK